MIITSVSHLDHALTVGHLVAILEHFKDRDEFFIETVSCAELDVPQLTCALYGPLMGDEPVPESIVEYELRGDRQYTSRILDVRTIITQLDTPVGCWEPKDLPNDEPLKTAWMRPTDQLTVIAGPLNAVDLRCTMYTAFGGPPTPKEYGDLAPRCHPTRAPGDPDGPLLR